MICRVHTPAWLESADINGKRNTRGIWKINCLNTSRAVSAPAASRRLCLERERAHKKWMGARNAGWFTHAVALASGGPGEAGDAPLIKHTRSRAHPAQKDRRPAASLCSGWWISRCGALARDVFAAITLICPKASKSWKTRARFKGQLAVST